MLEIFIPTNSTHGCEALAPMLLTGAMPSGIFYTQADRGTGRLLIPQVG